MSDPTWRIRVARAEDAARLSALAERTFRDAFAPLNAASDIDLYCAGAFAPALQAAEITDPLHETLLVEQGSDLVAYAQLHRCPAPGCVTASAPIELKRFYVLQTWHGSGVAAALMEVVTARAARAGADVMWLGVWERNARAIRFYRKCGFTEAGEHIFVVGTDKQRDLIMAAKVRCGPIDRAR